MKIYLYDSSVVHDNLLPLSFTRPIADIRCGILTIFEKWKYMLPDWEISYFPVEYLRNKFGSVKNCDEEVLFIAANILPRANICQAILSLIPGQAIINLEIQEDYAVNPKHKPYIIAFRGSLSQFENQKYEAVSFNEKIYALNFVFDIFLNNPEEIKLDFQRLTEGKKSQPLPPCVKTLSLPSSEANGQEPIENLVFIEQGATVECATINVSKGPVYVGKNAILMEGACIRGPFALCEESEVRMGAKIYEGTTIGPHCKVGGEISNTVFFGYSNKAHDGYLGNAVIGEWCNIGAGTNASNLKNDYSLIRVWNYRTRTFMRTDLQFCGLIMGDHSKIGVNCMINTATVLGVGVNIHGSGFPRSFVPCFCEGSPVTGFSTVPLKKFLQIVDRVMSRRDMKPSEQDLSLLKHIYDNQ